MHRNSLRFCVLAHAALVPVTRAITIPTSFGVGADAEVRDHQPATNFGASTELGTRIVDNAVAGSAGDSSDRFGLFYLKFDLTGSTLAGTDQVTLRLTYRNSNLTPNRVQDMTPPGNLDFRTGIAFYGLDRDHAGNSWVESIINYSNAPGIVSDTDIGTKDFDFTDPDGAGALRAPLSSLGAALFPVVAPQNHLPVGGSLLFSSTALRTFVQTSLNASKTTVTIIGAVVHDGVVPVTDWKNFLYLFNPKEMATLNMDTGYDSDTTNPSNPLGSPFSGASNATNAFSPQLIFAPLLTGDANRDGQVNTMDFTIVAQNFNETGTTPSSGDFNADGKTNALDFNALASNFGRVLGAGDAVPTASLVPEPLGLGLLVPVLNGLRRRR